MGSRGRERQSTGQQGVVKLEGVPLTSVNSFKYLLYYGPYVMTSLSIIEVPFAF